MCGKTGKHGIEFDLWTTYLSEIKRRMRRERVRASKREREREREEKRGDRRSQVVKRMKEGVFNSNMLRPMK